MAKKRRKAVKGRKRTAKRKPARRTTARRKTARRSSKRRTTARKRRSPAALRKSMTKKMSDEMCGPC